MPERFDSFALSSFSFAVGRRQRRRRVLLALFSELAHGQKLEDPILDVLQSVVVLVEHAAGLRHVELLGAPLVPGQLGDRLEVRADDLGLHGLPADARQPLPLPVDFLAGVLGQVERVELRAQLLQALVRAAVGFAELLLNGLELLAQVHLALPAADLFLDLGLDVLLRRKHVDLALHVDEDAPQPVLDRERLEQDLLGGGRERRGTRRPDPPGGRARRPRRGSARRLRRATRDAFRAPRPARAPRGAGRRTPRPAYRAAAFPGRPGPSPRGIPACSARSAGRCRATCLRGPGGSRPARAGPSRSWRSSRSCRGPTESRSPTRCAGPRRRPGDRTRPAPPRSPAASRPCRRRSGR